MEAYEQAPVTNVREMRKGFITSFSIAAAVAATFTGQALAAVPDRGSSESATGSPAGQIVKFETDYGYGKEYFSVEVRDPEQLRIAKNLLDGVPGITTTIPAGRLVKEPSTANPGYQWNVDPDSFEFAEISGEFCNAPPSMVKPGNEVWEWDAYCPQMAKVVAIVPDVPR
ncbi:hypothetical protein [Streptomyces sp. NPDC057910]|uniref:BP74-related protein n=1 Tax=Streptomyces sp. NPDC057910 TaxID=3346278 RepID=UPI0036E55C33